MNLVGVVALVVLLLTGAPFATDGGADAAERSADAAARTSPPAIGEAAPELLLRDQNGRAFVLHDVLKERDFIILAFYPKAFTSG